MKEIFRGPLAVRNHNAFTSGNGLSSPAWGSTNLYHERADGSMALDWRWADRVYDVFAEHGWEPIIELGFMPRDLSVKASGIAGPGPGQRVGPEPYENGAWRCPPKSYARWSELCQAFVTHLVERYGASRVERWRFEVWNEPDIPYYWRGSLEEYCQLYEASRAGVRRALSGAQVGGPATTEAGTEFLRQVLARVSRPDFVSFHTKGAYYSPRRHYNPFVPPPRESPSLGKMIEDVRSNVAIIQERYRDVPILVDECDPAVGTPYGVFDTPNFVVANTTHYPTMVCALAKELLEYPTVERFTSWAFYMEGKRWFEGNQRSSPTRTSSSRSSIAPHARTAGGPPGRRPCRGGGRPGRRSRGDRLSSRRCLVGGRASSRPPSLRGRAARGSLPRLGSSHAKWLEMGAPNDPSA